MGVGDAPFYTSSPRLATPKSEGGGGQGRQAAPYLIGKLTGIHITSKTAIPYSNLIWG